MADHTVIPERDYQAALDLILEYGLDAHDKNIKPLREEAGLPGPHQRFAWDCLQAKLAPFREYHEKYPFRTPPPGSVDTSPRSWLRVFANDHFIAWLAERATRHTLILGQIGMGKSTLIRHVATSALDAGKVVKAWDLKSDLRDLAVQHDFFIVAATTAFQPLARVPYLSAPEQASITIDCFRKAFFIAENANQILYPVLLRLWQHSERPTIKDLHDQILSSIKPTDTYNQKDAARRIAARLQRLITAYPAATTTAAGPTIAEVNDRHVHVDGSIHLDATAFLILLFSALLYAARRAQGRRDWTHVIVADEANLIAGDGTQTVQGTSLYHDHYQLFREYGINVTLASSNRLDQSITTNAGTIVALPNPSETEYLASLLRLTPKQTEYFARMPRGECLVRLVGYPDVIHAKFDAINADKHVPPERWTAAAERHNPVVALPASTPEASQTRNEPPVVPVTVPATPLIALNKSEEALLTVVADAGVTPSTPAYKKAGLGLADGDAAAKHLVEKGLLVRERITLHAGRGGHGIGLQATQPGLARVGKERAIKTRGGDSVQHRYLIKELHHVLPGSTVEGVVGTKSVDLLVPLNEDHGTLTTYLQAHTAIPLNGLIAIEVETSAPAKTAPNNITKNHEAGITLTVVSVLPKDEKTTKHALKDLPAPFVVVNVLDLINHLSTPHKP